MEDVDQLRWPLCVIAMESQYLSLNCASLLAERLNWYTFNDGEEMDEEEREAFLEAIQSGDCFDFLSLQEYPVALQNQTIEYYFALERCCRYHPEYVIPFLAIEGPWFVPDDAKLHRKLLRWYSSVQTGMAELLPVAEQWQVEAPTMKMPVIIIARNGCTVARGKPDCRSLCVLAEPSLHASG